MASGPDMVGGIVIVGDGNGDMRGDPVQKDGRAERKMTAVRRIRMAKTIAIGIVESGNGFGRGAGI